jgi:lipopolysaccharide/colanic/teichoic acid biosynthesis glycosyltransferase
MLTNAGLDQTAGHKVARKIRLKLKKARKLFSILFIVEDESRVVHSIRGKFTCVSFERAGSYLNNNQPDIILVSTDLGHEFGKYMSELKEYGRSKAVPLVLYSPAFSKLGQNIAIRFGFDEYYFGVFSEVFFRKIRFYKKLKSYKCKKLLGIARMRRWHFRRVNFLKRAIDIAASSILLIALSPVLLLIALLIKAESAGPVFYVSRRAGYGYRIFNFYKFRSMRVNADKEISELLQHNQYGESAFFKMRNDPRVTRLGNFLRCTSLDELPQLINVLKGDMSLVGNRPLPLYEAEQLTRDKAAGRFLAPAGITGLWQITKRGKREVSEGERIKLDIIYTRKWSVWYDLKILFGTLPALFQKESV